MAVELASGNVPAPPLFLPPKYNMYRQVEIVWYADSVCFTVEIVWWTFEVGWLTVEVGCILVVSGICLLQV